MREQEEHKAQKPQNNVEDVDDPDFPGIRRIFVRQRRVHNEAHTAVVHTDQEQDEQRFKNPRHGFPHNGQDEKQNRKDPGHHGQDSEDFEWLLLHHKSDPL